MDTQEASTPRFTQRGLGELLAAATRDPTADLLLRLVDVSLAGVVFLAPLVMAGRHPWGRLVLVALIAMSAVSWAFYQARRRRGNWTRTGVEWIIVAGAALLVVQLLPLPANWLYSLSPHLPDALPLWSGSEVSTTGLGSWTQISLHPEATRGGLTMYLAYALLFVVVVQRVETREDAERLVRWVAIAATGMALLGLFQLLTSNGNFLWLYAHPSRTTRSVVKGTFANQDHFAHFLALGLGPLLWWGHRQIAPAVQRRRRFTQSKPHEAPDQVARLVLGGAFAVVGLAGLLTFSRGGLLAMLLAALTCGAIFWYHRLSGQRALWGVLGIGTLLGASLWIYGSEPLMDELQTLGGGSWEELDKSQVRRQLWLAGMRSTADYPLVGTGAGTHRDVYPAYFPNHTSFEYSHAENGYLQVFEETGLAGFLLLLVGISYVVRWCARLVRRADDVKSAALAGAIAASVAASLFHALVDFVWYIPACFSITVILVACACRLAQLSRQQPRRPASLPRSAWIGAVLVLLLISFGMMRNCVPSAAAATHWDRYLALAFAVNQADAAHADSTPDDVAGGSLTPVTIALMQRHLDRVLLANPYDARAHLRMAQWNLKAFEIQQQGADNAMALHQIRDAAVASQFASRAELDQWLQRAVGPHRQRLWAALDHTRQALRLCPLQGEGYVYMAELAFLESRTADAKFAYLNQAVRVRPYDHDVLLAVGRESALVGDVDRAVTHWRTVFQQGGEPRQMLLRTLADQLPAQFVVEQFQPDLPALRRLYVRYSETGQEMQARFVAAPLAQSLKMKAQSQSGADAAASWYELHSVYRFLDDAPRALESARLAVEAAPDDFHMHRVLADRLLDNKRYDDAVAQFQWCMRRRPDDTRLKQKLMQASRQR